MKRAFIIVHGVLRDADYYYDTGVIAASAHEPIHVVIAPQFVEEGDHGNVSPQTLYWDGEWPGGSDALAPAQISTYDVLDAMVARLSDRGAFRSCARSCCGHSAGGQIVQRYAVVGKAPQLDAGSLDAGASDRREPVVVLLLYRLAPVPQQNCGDFNEWRYGSPGRAALREGTAAQLESATCCAMSSI